MGGTSASCPEQPHLAAQELLYWRSQSFMNRHGRMTTIMKGYCTLLSAEVIELTSGLLVLLFLSAKSLLPLSLADAQFLVIDCQLLQQPALNDTVGIQLASVVQASSSHWNSIGVTALCSCARSHTFGLKPPE